MDQDRSPEPPAQAPLATAPVLGSRPAGKQGRGPAVLNILLGGALVLAIAGVAFAVGRMTAPAPTITGASFPGGITPGQGGFNPGGGQGNPNGGNFPGGGGAFGLGGITLEGTVESISATTLTLRTSDGQTVQVSLDGSTTYHAQSDASASDVATGKNVIVRVGGGFRGGPGASGSPAGLTATDVTVSP